MSSANAKEQGGTPPGGRVGRSRRGHAFISSRDRPTEGFTLLEAIVGSVLALIVLGLIVQILIPTGKASVRGGFQVEVQQTAALAMRKLVEDLSLTPIEGIATAPDGCAVQVLRGADAQGTQLWSDRLVLYKRTQGRLMRWEWPPGSPNLARGVPVTTEPFAPTPAEMTQLLALPPPNARTLGRNFKAFSVTRVGGRAEVRMELEAQPPDGKAPERFTLSQDVYLRNERY